MASDPTKNEQIKNRVKKNSRRRKKRRTEDFSSLSLSSSESESEREVAPTADDVKEDIVEVDDADMVSDSEDPRALSDETRVQLSAIKLTSMALSAGSGRNVDTAKVSETLARDRSELNKEFLTLMASTFSNDLDELRKKPDFSLKSLPILAKALQSGANMFDEDTLNAILSK